MDTTALIDEMASLPVEERALIAESLLQSLNQPEAKIDVQWLNVANKRLKDLQSGNVKSIDGEVVFNKIRHRFKK